MASHAMRLTRVRIAVMCTWNGTRCYICADQQRCTLLIQFSEAESLKTSIPQVYMNRLHQGLDFDKRDSLKRDSLKWGKAYKR
jgi:hypothetical protein